MTPYIFTSKRQSTDDVKAVILSTAIGSNYFSNWSEFARHTWEQYAEKYGIGILVHSHPVVTRDNEAWLPERWHKMIAPSFVKDYFPKVAQILVLDSDVLISPIAPNVFELHDTDKFGVVSSKNLPFNREATFRMAAYLRHHRFSERYPLDSSLFQPVSNEFTNRGFPVQEDFFTAGFILMNSTSHTEMVASWYREVSVEQAVETHERTGQWEEPFLNWRIQETGDVQWFDYRFQSIWLYEAARRFPMIFDWVREPEKFPELVRAIEYALWDSYFLHFAGAWDESEAWKLGKVFSQQSRLEDVLRWGEYLATPLTGEPRGKILPGDKR